MDLMTNSSRVAMKCQFIKSTYALWLQKYVKVSQIIQTNKKTKYLIIYEMNVCLKITISKYIMDLTQFFSDHVYCGIGCHFL